MCKGRIVLGVSIGFVLMSLNGADASMTPAKLNKCLSGCCTKPAGSTAKANCIADCWKDYRAKLWAGVAGGTLGVTSVSIADSSEGYRHVSQASSDVYNNMVYQPGQLVDVTVNENAEAHDHCINNGNPVACCTGFQTGNCVTSVRLILLEPVNNPDPGICSNGTNNAGPFCNEDADCSGGNTCTGVRKTCQGGASPGTPCATDGNCSGGNTCERTFGLQVDVCTDNGTTWSCSWTPTAEHYGALMVEPKITGRNVDVDPDVAMVFAGTKIWGIPAVSEWGIVVLTLLVVSAATVVLGRQRSRSQLA